MTERHTAMARAAYSPWICSSLRAALAGLAIAALAAHGARAQDAAEPEGDVIRAHGYSYFGDLKYPEDFAHFDYVNPDAPKGGEIALDASGTFDSMNPYSRKGRAGAYSWMVYESLLGDMPATSEGLPADTYGEAYGLLAESLEYDAGKTWVIFHMRPEARFSDGTPVTAHDVVFSHNLFLEQGLQSYAEAVKRHVTGAEALDDHTVKFTFAEGISRRSLVDQVGAVPVFPKAWYEETGARLDEPRLDAAPGSGPYMLDEAEVNRRIVYKRNPDYWGRDLPINVGRHNFDTIRIEYFADDSAAFQAFKVGEYTFRAETNSKTWATGYDFPAVQKGWVVLEDLPDGTPPTPSGIVFNLGRETLQDKRVRQAIALGFNFEWTNESLQYGLFKQRESFVQDTPLQAKGVPEGKELELLQSLGDVIPPEMLTEPAMVPHTSDPSRLTDRRNLRRAMALLDEAGWPVGPDGTRRNAAGEPLSLEFPIPSSGSSTIGAVVENFIKNLQAMGIEARMEKIDPSQYTLRSRDRDYDLVFDNYTAFLQPGTGLMQRFGSQEAAFSLFNPAGLASPMVDAIINAALETDDAATQDAALTALDRALRYEAFMIPVWYNDAHWVAYWDMFEHPETMPPYALGVLDFWWWNAEKAAALNAAGALR
ncbi:ABC transporter substrate-binding protein [Pelagivirga sediminicola]|uniref:ABC transporter substrate-binding protein n=1 Tax=Pelagivirga sediminicola TaxID=2170575 RepID=A0A2T7G9R1_9RHOB|nr:extracellular solute-binding protein [Pelagivirga sediminicola]PVA11162.1 ABC transporter substrate-binding protein [Pelagivirga sediminicola]